MLEDITTVVGKRPEVAVVDQGYGKAQRIGDTEVVSVRTLRGAKNCYSKRKTSERLRRRAAIDPVIGHLKSNFRLARNYLKGALGDHINVLLAACALITSESGCGWRRVYFAHFRTVLFRAKYP